MNNQTPTGLKALFQSLIPDTQGVIEGTVTSFSPLQVTLANDSKMILGMNSLIVPKHLTDYQIEVDLSAFSLTSGYITVRGSLKKGDLVYLLPFNGGKKYYILDRKEGGF